MRRPDLLVLCYHAVSPSWAASLSVSPASLRRQLGRLVGRGYESATFTNAVLEPRRRPTLCVTFDDAYRSVFVEALPVLEEVGVKGTVFAPTAFIGQAEPMSWRGIESWLDTQHRDELVPMSWEELAALREHGWEVGSHTCTHPRLSQAEDDALERELHDSRREIESRLGTCTSLAYPYGDHDDRVVEAAGRAGYLAAATLPTRLLPPTELAWPRLGVYHADGDGVFALKVSRAVRSLRRTRAWDAAYRVARALR